MADLVIRTLGSRSGKKFVAYDVAYGPGFEDLRKRVPDLTRIRQAIGFTPRYTLEQTIRDIAASMGGGLDARVGSGSARIVQGGAR